MVVWAAMSSRVFVGRELDLDLGEGKNGEQKAD
jgi:hypothetical protein